jgi:UDP-N-acetylmuramate--alanine ligase
VIGGNVPGLGGKGGARGKGKHLVVEACEFARSFLDLAPALAVLTGIEEDHMDCYQDLGDLRGAFADFVARLRMGGAIIAWDGIDDLNALLRGNSREVLTYGLTEAATFQAQDLVSDSQGTSFSLLHRGDPLGAFRVNQPGQHSVLNATAAVVAALQAGCALEQVRLSLPEFAGVSRRMERCGCFGAVTLYSDYAHHPSEIAAVAQALRTAHPGQRLVTAYQAHQRTRTAYFLDGLAESLARFDAAFVVETFSVREQAVEDLPGGEELTAAVRKRGGRADFIGSLGQAVDNLCPHLEERDVLVIMGAGDIDEITRPVAEKLRRS